MKKLLFAVLALVCACAVSVTAEAQSDSQSLGDYARAVRKNKPEETKAASKVYDNDNIPANTSISVVGDTKAAPATDTAAATNAAAANSTATASDAATTNNPATASNAANNPGQANQANDETKKAQPGQSLKEREQVYTSWKKRIDDQKKKVDELTRELDGIKNNASMPQAPVWPYNQKYQDGVAAKQKDIDAAKAQLSDLQEQARRAGVPSSYIE